MNNGFDDNLTAAEARQAGQLSLFLVLDGYEGPIDLLLDLARDQKIDLTQIAILPLAEQYLSYISTMQENWILRLLLTISSWRHGWLI